MEQEQPQPPKTNLPPTNPESSSKRRWPLMAIIIGIAALLVAVAIILTNLGQGTKQEQAQSAKPLTIGDKPYLYPCSVATREGYAKAFGLDDDKVGTVTERSALPRKDIKEGGDLTKLAPGNSSEPRHSAQCSYTLAKKGASQMNRIEVEILQFASDDEAKDELKSARNRAAGVFLSDEDVQLPALPSFTAEDSYVKEPKQGFSDLRAGFVVGSRSVALTYQLIRSDTPETIIPQLDAYAKEIKSKIAAGTKTEALDMTGHDTKVGAKLVDVCRRTSLPELSRAFNGIEFRPDEVTDISTYGSLDGSRAAADGAESYCAFEFNTEQDRQAIAALNEKEKPKEEFGSDDPLGAAERWPHKMTLAVNTYKSADEAKAALATKKESAAKPIGGVVAEIKDLTGVGDAAYTLTRQTDLSLDNLDGSKDVRLLLQNVLTVLEGKNIIVVELQQLQENDQYQTAPIAVNDSQLKKAFRLIDDTVSKNRK